MDSCHPLPYSGTIKLFLSVWRALETFPLFGEKFAIAVPIVHGYCALPPFRSCVKLGLIKQRVSETRFIKFSQAVSCLMPRRPLECTELAWSKLINFVCSSYDITGLFKILVVFVACDTHINHSDAYHLHNQEETVDRKPKRRPPVEGGLGEVEETKSGKLYPNGLINSRSRRN